MSEKVEISMAYEEMLQKVPAQYRDSLKLDDITYTEEQLAKRYNGIYNRVIKRTVDCIIALTAFIILLSFYGIVSALIAFETGIPVLYTPERGGYRGKTFRIKKFRSMVKNADKIGGGTTALNDARITKVGAFLRKAKLDETAQLLNVINGTMAFIGPRPELLRYTNQYKGIEKNILNVRPGITDFSSLTFINLDEIVGQQDADLMYETLVLPKKNQLRLKYVAEVSFKTDVKLFFGTVGGVLKKVKRILTEKR